MYKQKPLAERVQTKAEELARILIKRNEMKVYRPVAYCFREIIRNVFEHSGAPKCALVAQTFSNEVTEFAVLDRGVGIPANICKAFKLTDEREALLHAMSPGISSSPSVDEDDNWGNSGFGLYVLSELGKETGYFKVLSGNCFLNAEGKLTEVIKYPFEGTLIGIRIQKPKGVNFADYIDAIVKKGEAKAAQCGNIRKASKKTREV